MRMGRFLAELDKLEQELRSRPAHPLVGTPSLHAAQISGGTALSIYAEQCVLKIERRLTQGETVEQATAELQAIIDTLSAQDPTFQATVKPFFWRMPFETDPKSELIQIVDSAITERLGKPIPHIGMSGWTDAGILAKAGIESILLGPIGDGLHTTEEWVDIQSVVDLAGILVETAVRFCGMSNR